MGGFEVVDEKDIYLFDTIYYVSIGTGKIYDLPTNQPTIKTK